MSQALAGARAQPVWVERLRLTNFRSYAELTLSVGAGPVVLVGANGAGKTNLLEALSLLVPGQGLRRTPYGELARNGADSWAVAARVHGPAGAVDIGTGLSPSAKGTGGADTALAEGARAGRRVRINGADGTALGARAELGEMVWLTPAMDGLFSGPAAERRRFLDRLIGCLDPGYRALAARFTRAMQHRNRLLAQEVREPARFAAFERVMAEAGVAVAAARCAALAELAAAVALARDSALGTVFPWAELSLVGALETALAQRPAVEVEDVYAAALAKGRERDRAAHRTLEGPHRSDLRVAHGPKRLPAASCSTGEQKALLIGVILAHADLLARRARAAPILLLDEVAAHLDAARRAMLFSEVLSLGSQAWMSGSDQQAFSALWGRAQMLRVEEGRIAVMR
jgi:DNA replication and repair protein RecF